MEIKFCLLVIPLIFFQFQESGQISLEEELTLTGYQKSILDKFKDSVSARLPHAYMTKDIYLIKWLRASNFNQKIAENKLFENLDWREKNKMDSIIYEDFSEWEREYPYYLEGCDKLGRPVATAPVGDWNVRKAVVTGKKDKLLRYGYKLLEEITTLIREGQKLGRNVTQFSVLVNMDHFTIAENACPSCLPVFLNILLDYEAYYPGYTHKTILVNTPAVFDNTLNIIRPLMSPTLRETLVVFGKNKKQWQNWLLNEFSKDQLTKTFGGKKESPITPHDLRTNKVYPC